MYRFLSLRFKNLEIHKIRTSKLNLSCNTFLKLKRNSNPFPKGALRTSKYTRMQTTKKSYFMYKAKSNRLQEPFSSRKTLFPIRRRATSPVIKSKMCPPRWHWTSQYSCQLNHKNIRIQGYKKLRTLWWKLKFTMTSKARAWFWICSIPKASEIRLVRM